MSPEPSPKSIRFLIWVAVVVALALVAFAASAIIPGSHSAAPQTAIRSIAAKSSSRDTLPTHITTVFGSNLTAKQYGTLDGDRENQGVNSTGQLTSDLTPIPVADFKAPIAVFRRYTEGVAVRLGSAVTGVTAALTSDNRALAKRRWIVAFADYLDLGAVYGLIPNSLNNALAEVPTNIGDRHFPGLHMIEKGLWTGESLRSLVPVATALAGAVVRLRKALPTVSITPLPFATRAHEILEDAQRDLMSTSQVPWSGAGVLGTAAGVAATRELIKTQVALLQGRDNVLVESDNWLGVLQAMLNHLRRRNGSWPTVAQLTQYQREQLNGTLAGTLSALELIPGALETHSMSQFPAIPRKQR